MLRILTAKHGKDVAAELGFALGAGLMTAPENFNQVPLEVVSSADEGGGEDPGRAVPAAQLQTEGWRHLVRVPAGR
jgi:hypothetical protein